MSEHNLPAPIPRARALLLALFLATGPHARANKLEEVRDCCAGHHLTIGIPPLTYEPLFTYDAAAPAWGGLLTDMFDTLSLTMGFTYSVVAAPPYELDPDTGLFMLGGGMADLVISDLSAPSMQMDTRVLKTMPFHNSYFSGIVLKTKKALSLFRFLDPFDASLYLTIFIFVVGTAALLTVLDLIWPADDQSRNGVKSHRMCDGEHDLRDTLVAFASSTYHMTAATLGGEDYEWLTWPLKVLRVGVLLVVLVVNATYTANLAAFLVAPSVTVHGPKSMDELGDAVVCALSEGEWAATAARSFGGSMVVASQEELPDTPELGSLSNVAERKAWVADMLDSRGCDIWLHDYVVLQGIYLESCASRELTSFIAVSPITYGFVGQDAGVVANVSAGLVALQSTPAFEELRRSYFGPSCLAERAPAAVYGRGGSPRGADCWSWALCL